MFKISITNKDFDPVHFDISIFESKLLELGGENYSEFIEKITKDLKSNDSVVVNHRIEDVFPVLFSQENTIAKGIEWVISEIEVKRNSNRLSEPFYEIFLDISLQLTDFIILRISNYTDSSIFDMIKIIHGHNIVSFRGYILQNNVLDIPDYLFDFNKRLLLPYDTYSKIILDKEKPLTFFLQV